MKFLIIASIFLGSFASTFAQDSVYARSQLNELCSPTFSGRGYINKGVNRAGDYLADELKRNKVKPFNGGYQQYYSFPINTHPYAISCEVDKKPMSAGKEFLVNPGSPSVSGSYLLRHFNISDSLDQFLLSKKLQNGFDKNEALVISHANRRGSGIADSFKKYNNTPSLLILTELKKLTHSLSTEVDDYPSLTFIDSAIHQRSEISIQVKNELIPSYECSNVMGYIKGKKKDSFIVLTAHYDHLGMQGTEASFYGASDNASGTAMVLDMARYFSKIKPEYTIVFILFSGEEAGLIGSEFFTINPCFNLNKIKFLINIDIMGNAENGITVVNGETHQQAFNLLSSINKEKKYIPEVKIRGKAANSDHYHFSEKGAPAIFIYSMGGPGYYHDVWDTPSSCTLTNFMNVESLLIEFIKAL